MNSGLSSGSLLATRRVLAVLVDTLWAHELFAERATSNSPCMAPNETTRLVTAGFIVGYLK
jgi:hypothetical protein